MRILLVLTMASALAVSARAAVTKSTLHSADVHGLDGQIAAGDLISGLIATELPGDLGWHGANTNPVDQLPAFTDDMGFRDGGLTGLLNDFPPTGQPTKRVQYDLAGPTDIGQIHVLTGNGGGDGRIFSTFTVSTSTNNGGSFDLLGYFESDPLGTLNNANSDPRYQATLVKVFDDASATLASSVTNLQFEFYGVDNTGGQYRDPFDGVNPFTGIDDLQTPPNTSPLVFEIDVLPVPEPATLAGFAWAVAAVFVMAWRRR